MTNYTHGEPDRTYKKIYKKLRIPYLMISSARAGSPMQYPPQIEIIPLTKPPNASVRVPGSKSITNRALVLAALSSGGMDIRLRGALRSDDTEIMMSALRTLGFHVLANLEHDEISVFHDEGMPIPSANADIFVGNSGTSMRFLTALVSLGHGRFRVDGIARMRERPIEDLLIALRQLGVNARSELGNGCPPVVIEADGLPGGEVRIRGNISSQFLSGLLMAASGAKSEVVITLDGELVSVPYVALTIEMMRQFGFCVENSAFRVFRVRGREYSLGGYEIEPDASAASYFWGAAAIAGGCVRVEKLTTHSLQGDIRLVDILEEMGCQVVRADTGATVHGGPLHGIDVDMNDISDTVMTLAVVACFAEGPTTIRNVAHIRHKESDRLSALATELRRIGAEVVEREDGLTITPRPLHGAIVQTYNDHRMAMSLALVGLKIPGIVIDNPACVAKTYPRFFEDLERLR
jgi:3-phosphoshikimate 1-carboxyvinyltransferase